MQERAEHEAAGQVNMNEVERKAIEELAVALAVSIQDITADGHCLYNAISDQLLQHYHIEVRCTLSLMHLASCILNVESLAEWRLYIINVSLSPSCFLLLLDTLSIIPSMSLSPPNVIIPSPMSLSSNGRGAPMTPSCYAPLNR